MNEQQFRSQSELIESEFEMIQKLIESNTHESMSELLDRYFDLFKELQKTRKEKTTLSSLSKALQTQYKTLQSKIKILDNDCAQFKELKSNFASFMNEYKARGLLFKATLRTKKLELDRANGQFKKICVEKSTLLQNCSTLNSKFNNQKRKELKLHKQLQAYVFKFKQVEETLNKSNELFVGFRKEMTSMSLRTKKLELDNEESFKLIRDRTKERDLIFEKNQSTEMKLHELQKKYDQIECLCRALQKERISKREGLQDPSNRINKNPDVD